jgi:predicted protein tyrosine phosphatase
MIKDIDFLSVAQMRRVRPSLDTVVVSILDNSESTERPRLAGFRSVLSLEFEDTSEESKKHEPGSWPDEPTDEEHARFALYPGERAPTLTDAERIVEFIRRHHASPDALNLVVHCHGGISRSAAVAHWASARLWVPMSNANMRSTDRANPRLLRLLDRAAGVR